LEGVSTLIVSCIVATRTPGRMISAATSERMPAMIATRLMIAQQLMDAIIESESESGRACRRGVRRRPFSEMRADDDSGACLSQSGPRGETRARIGRGRSDSVCELFFLVAKLGVWRKKQMHLTHLTHLAHLFLLFRGGSPYSRR
jgi:hypothetical protein